MKSNLNMKVKAMLPFLLLIALDFYLLPLLINDTGTAIFILLGAIPFICLACSVWYGVKHSFHFLYSLFVTILFVPTVFLFYNTSAWVYIIAYGVIAMIGNLIGMIFFNRRK